MKTYLLTTTLGILAAVLYFYTKWAFNYWARRGVPSYPKHVTYLQAGTDAYSHFKSKELKYGGIYMMMQHMYLVIDLDMIKTILQTDFDHFVNRGLYVNENDPLNANLLSLENDKWRTLSTKIRPTFTPGKMRMMFPTIMDCTPSLVYILKQSVSEGNPVDIKDLMARFTTDVIGSVAFGVNCNSLANPNCKFRQVGKEFAKVTWRIKIARLVPSKILRAINFKVRNKGAVDFFMNFVKNIVNYREDNNIYRKDFLHMMLQLKNRGKITNDNQIMENNIKGEYMKLPEVAAQCFLFFLGGFDTSSAVITFVFLELAQHQDVQDKLREEMKEVIKKHEGITYDAIMEMTYLDQVVNECLRLYPPVFATLRCRNTNLKAPKTDVDIEIGTKICIPIYSIHRDSEYYPDPETFNPERFSPENKAQRHPFAFIPFGAGPRKCAGERLGLLQTKIGLTAVLTNFRVTLNSRTTVPVEYDPKSATLSVKGKVWLNISKTEDL